jgi:hypothetical protein
MGDTANDSSKVVEITTLEEKKPQSRKGSSQGDVEEIDTGGSIGDFALNIGIKCIFSNI